MINSYNAYKRLDRPLTYLASANKDHIGAIQSRELVTDLCLNNISDATFKVNKYENGELTSNYNDIENLMLVEISNIGWFQITDTKKVGNGNNEHLEITASSLENEACSKTLTSFGQLGVETDEQGGLDRYCLYSIADTDHSILHIWLEKLPSWKIGYIDPTITKEYRAFNDDNVAAYSFLTSKVSEAFECIFQFDTFEQTVSAYKLENLGKTTSIYLSYRNLVKQNIVNSSASDIKTVLTVSGGDDRGTPLGIIRANPAGTNQIADFSYYKPKMSSALQQRLTSYETEYNNRLSSFTSALNTLDNMLVELGVLNTKLPSSTTSTNWTEYGLTELNIKYDYYNERMSLYIGKTDTTSLTNYNSSRVFRDAIEAERKIRKQQIATKETQITNQEAICKNLTLNLESYLGVELFKELSRYWHEDTFVDDTYIVTTEMTDSEELEMQLSLLTASKNKLAKISKPSFTIEVDAINFTTIPEFETYANQLELGNIITMDFGDDILVEGRILKLHINWDKPEDFSITVSSKNKLDGFEYEFAELQSQANTAGTAYGISGTGWNTAKNKTNTFDQYMTSTLDLAKQKLISSNNEEFIADNTGTLWRSWDDSKNDYSPNQMWGTKNGIFLTQNKWNTVSMAVGEGTYNGQTVYGIWAPLICGDLLLGNNLAIINSSGNFTINNNGLTATNGIYSVGINPNTPAEIINVKVNGSKKFYIDTLNNRMYFEGHIVATSGTFSGSLSAATGTFSGNLSAAGGTFTGTLQGVNGTFSGSLSAASGTFSGLLSGGSISINNKFLVDASGNMTSSSATITGGNFNIGSGNFTVNNSGDLYAKSATFGGTGAYLTMDATGLNIKYSQSSPTALTKIYYNSVQTDIVQVNNTLQLYDINSVMFINKPEGAPNNGLTGAFSRLNHNHTSDYSPIGHGHDSDKIMSVSTSFNNIRMGGSLNAASVDYVQSTFVRLDASDFRLKKNIRSLNELPIELYMELKPKQFEYKCDEYNKGVVFGLLAQEVISAFERYGYNALDYNLVVEAKVRSYTDEGLYCRDGRFYRVNYQNFIAWGILVNQTIYSILVKNMQ